MDDLIEDLEAAIGMDNADQKKNLLSISPSIDKKSNADEESKNRVAFDDLILL